MRRSHPEEGDHTALEVLVNPHQFKPSEDSGKPELIDDRALPEWQTRRPFILTGYRHTPRQMIC